jgi:hypothetical protein
MLKGNQIAPDFRIQIQISMSQSQIQGNQQSRKESVKYFSILRKLDVLAWKGKEESGMDAGRKAQKQK